MDLLSKLIGNHPFGRALGLCNRVSLLCFMKLSNISVMQIIITNVCYSVLYDAGSLHSIQALQVITTDFSHRQMY